MIKLHPTQERILKLSERVDITKLTLRAIGSLIDVDHPQKVRWHLAQLKKKGLLEYKGSIDLLASLKRMKDQARTLEQDINALITYLKIT